MLAFKRLAILLTVVSLLATGLEAKTRKGHQLLEQGRQAEARKQWEVALDFYEKAMLEDPADVGYQLAANRVRFQAAMAHVDAGQKLRSQGKLVEALQEFQRAFAIDPSIPIAEHEIKRTREMIDREKGTPSATEEERGMTPAEKAQKDAEQKASRILPVPELKPITRQISTLKMNNQPVKVLYETVGKLAGINVIFDSEYQTPPGKATFTVDLSNTTLEEALDYLAIQTKSYWKPLSPNAIFVTNDNVTKRRDYEDYVVKVFYIKNATTVQELQEISTTVRSVTEIRRAFTYNAMNAILVRGTADQVALAEKLIQDLDKPKPEVVVEVLVMEANRARVRDLAATLTTGSPAAPGLNLPVFYNKGTTTSTDDDDDDGGSSAAGLPLNMIKSLGLGDFSIVAPGALIQALMSDSETRVLQQPQVRAVEMQKASLKIGDRIPYATGSFQPGVGTVGLNPLVSTQFNFLDTGVNVDIVPKVHGRNEVSLHVELDVSTKSGEVELGGLRQPIVSRRTIVHDIRIQEGQVNILGGLLGTQETRIRSGIPYIMDIPILGRFFSNEKLDRARGELLIVLVPHVVRAPDFSEANLRGVSAGNDQNVKLQYAPRPEPAAPQEAPAQPETPAPAAPPAAEPAKEPGVAALPTGEPSLTFDPPAVQAPVGATITASLQVQNVNNLFTAPVRLKFDPKVLRLTSIRPGALMTGDGEQVNFSENTLNDTGEATITLNRIPGTGGVSGSGTLLTLTFQTVAPGTASVSVVEAGLRNMQLAPIRVGTPTLNVVVQ